MHRTRNAAYGQPYRGFESLPLRQFYTKSALRTGDSPMNIYLLRISLLAVVTGLVPGAAQAQLSKAAEKFFADYVAPFVTEHVVPHVAVHLSEAIEKCWREPQTCKSETDSAAAARFGQLSKADQDAMVRALNDAFADAERPPIEPGRLLTGH
jgi:hypothetical protein